MVGLVDMHDEIGDKMQVPHTHMHPTRASQRRQVMRRVAITRDRRVRGERWLDRVVTMVGMSDPSVVRRAAAAERGTHRVYSGAHAVVHQP